MHSRNRLQQPLLSLWSARYIWRVRASSSPVVQFARTRTDRRSTDARTKPARWTLKKKINKNINKNRGSVLTFELVSASGTDRVAPDAAKAGTPEVNRVDPDKYKEVPPVEEAMDTADPCPTSPPSSEFGSLPESRICFIKSWWSGISK